MKSIAVTAALAVVALPVAIVATILLLPLWRWIEATFGLESLGHSGPQIWCYGATYAVFVVAIVLTTRRRR